LGKALAAFLAFGMPLLAACSGGGGSATASAPAPVTPSPQASPAKTSGIAVNLQAPSTTVTYQAAAVTVVGAGKGMGNITIAVVGQGATITLGTDSSGNLSRVAIPAGSIDDTVVAAGGSGRPLTDPSTLLFAFQLDDVFGSASNTYGYSISQAAAGQGLTSSAYGIWTSVWKSPPADAGVFAFGNLTPAASVPATGSATFNGFTIGFGGPADGSAAFVLNGNVQIIANFGNQSVTTNLTNFSAGNISYTSSAKASVPNLTGTSAISGNAYTGPLSGGGLSGTINGNFYGSAAQETAGVWQASGGGNAWVGSFGAK
jgi:hypothetical protein